VEVITSTFGKALGGGTGGFLAGKQEIIDLMHQRARPYLFSNSVTPVIVGTSLFVLDFIQEHPELRDQLWKNVEYYRSEMTSRGFTVPASVHPIVPIMLGEESLASDMAKELLNEGIYVIGFTFPVVPKGKARIRVQISAAHTQEDIDQAVAAFLKVGKKFNAV
jgi:glycine C-acetyltransferase